MFHHVPWKVQVRDHPGSSEQDIKNEPDWVKLHAHAIGFKNRDDRRPGLTHVQEREEEIERSRRMREDLRRRKTEGDLVNFRDLILKQEDFHLRYPDNRSLGWRYVLETSEDWVKNQQRWPANLQKWEKEKEALEKKKEEEEKTKTRTQGSDEEDQQKDQDGHQGTPREEPKLTAQEQSLLATLEHEKQHRINLKVNDGKQKSPQTHNRSSISIDEQDQFTPDNWLPRCPDLIRLTGKHPMNAEPHLIHLFEGGLITPNELHFVRNHGSVPRLLWEFHRLDITNADNKTLSLSMDELKVRYTDSVINIPIVMACTGNRRKELNLLRRTKGANNAAASVGCAYWSGPTLRSVLLSAGIPEVSPPSGPRLWVNFAGADNLSEGTYETSIPLDYAMDPTNDVILAMQMNDLALPPDHGYPVRLMIPGWVGGRCVKWLRRIWVSERENESYYHIWDNRVLPSFVKDKEGPLAKALFENPSTICNEQTLNSVICRPAHGERIELADMGKGGQYTVRGFAYNGAGHEVQQVEISLDEGKTWLFAAREFPEYAIRHGNKFWAWVFWKVDVELTDLARAPGVMVRCSDAGKNLQPRESKWNILGMMNDSWYTIKAEKVVDREGCSPTMVFKHPTEAGASTGGWMQPSEELKLVQAKQDARTPQKQFTREEIEKHDKEDDCWIVVDGKVYDATSVLAWHPGGKTAIMAHAGKVHHETSEEFSSIHDDYGYQKLQECALGALTEKAANLIKQQAEAAAKERARNAQQQDEETKFALEKHRWVPVMLIGRREVTKDTRTYTFELPHDKPELGLGTCQHIQVGFHLQDKMLIRPYTPTRPIMPSSPASPTGQPSPSAEKVKVEQNQGNKPHTPPESPTTTAPVQPQQQHHSSRSPSTPPPYSKKPTFDLTVKTYFPDETQPGGALSNLLDCMPLGEEVEIRGPTGDIQYLGNGSFLISGAFSSEPRKLHFSRVSMVLGGSGITPGYALMAAIMERKAEDKTQVRVLDANKTEENILLKDDLDGFERESGGQIRVTHALSRAAEGWMGERGRVNKELIEKVLFPPEEGTVVFMCGPPGMIQKAALPALKDWGYVEDQNMFGF